MLLRRIRGFCRSGWRWPGTASRVEAALDDVAPLVALLVESGWPAAAAATTAAVRLLVRPFRDGVCDTAFPQVVAYISAAVSLVTQEMIRPGSRSARTWTANPDLREDLLQLCAVVDVAARDDKAERAAAAVAGEVNLGRQSATGSSDGVSVCRFCGICPFLRAPAAC